MRHLSSTLWLISIASLAAMAVCARFDLRLATALAAGIFAVSAIASGWLKLQSDQLRRESTETAAAAAAFMTAHVYAWGGAGMILIYRFSHVSWQHGWQYGSAMLLIGALLAIWASKIDERGAEGRTVPHLIAMTAVHVAAVVVALAWLITSGKLATAKGDWAANIFFVTGGITVAAIGAMLLNFHRTAQTSASA